VGVVEAPDRRLGMPQPGERPMGANRLPRRPAARTTEQRRVKAEAGLRNVAFLRFTMTFEVVTTRAAFYFVLLGVGGRGVTGPSIEPVKIRRICSAFVVFGTIKASLCGGL